MCYVCMPSDLIIQQHIDNVRQVDSIGGTPSNIASLSCGYIVLRHLSGFQCGASFRCGMERCCEGER